MPATLEAIGLGLAMTRKRVKEESGGKRKKERKKKARLSFFTEFPKLVAV